MKTVKKLWHMLIILVMGSFVITGFKIYIEAGGQYTIGGTSYIHTEHQDPTKHADPDGPYLHQPDPYIAYRINSDGTQDLSLATVIPAIQSSFQSWENVTPATIDFTYSGTTAQKQNN
ncbi:MAG: hypothetical protein ACE5D6_08850, partial [Candidatus Zixiibacteriota bacterium]